MLMACSDGVTNSWLLYLQRKRLSLQYAVKISSCFMNPTVECVFNLKSTRLFARKLTQIAPEYESVRTWVVLVLAIKTARYALFHLFLHGCYVALILIMTCMHLTKIVSVQKFYRIILQKPRMVLASMLKYTLTEIRLRACVCQTNLAYTPQNFLQLEWLSNLFVDWKRNRLWYILILFPLYKQSKVCCVIPILLFWEQGADRHLRHR